MFQTFQHEAGRDSGSTPARSGPGLAQVWPRSGPGLVQVWSRCSPGLAQVWTRSGPGLAQVWPRRGPGVVQAWPRSLNLFIGVMREVTQQEEQEALGSQTGSEI
ncbi:uncharacterized protein V6R79_000455 [Siganus canaliculatus]